MNLLEATHDPALFGPWFDRGDWRAWRAFLAAIFALPMDAEQQAIYRKHTGRSAPPQALSSEAWLVCGRRAGKSFIAALIAVWLAVYRDYRGCLAPGERGTVLILAADRKQARVIMRYVKGLLSGIPMLAVTVERETGESIDISTGITIEIGTASFRATRGYTIVAALFDEVAFWRSDDSANPDSEILNAVQPGMATIPDAMLIGLSSPYSKRGVLWDAYRRYFGQDNADVLVWQADTRAMNPSVPQRFIDAAYERDAVAAAAEYGAQFRSDLEAFINRESVEASQRPDPIRIPPARGIGYTAFVDPSGGRRDAMTLAIAHHDSSAKRVIVDAAVERRPPFSPEDVVADFAGILKEYRLTRVSGDRYAGEWPREAFKRHGVTYEVATKVRSELYRDTLPLFTSGKLELPPGQRIALQFASLERRTSRSGRDSIDHPPGAHDDLANAIAGVAVMAGQRSDLERYAALAEL